MLVPPELTRLAFPELTGLILSERSRLILPELICLNPMVPELPRSNP